MVGQKNISLLARAILTRIVNHGEKLGRVLVSSPNDLCFKAHTVKKIILTTLSRIGRKRCNRVVEQADCPRSSRPRVFFSACREGRGVMPIIDNVF